MRVIEKCAANSRARPNRFRVAPLGSVDRSPLGDRDATLGLCKLQRLEVTRSGTASITSRGPRGVGRDVGPRARELLREIARSHEMTIYARSINRDQDTGSVSRAVQYLKGKSSHKLLSEYK